MTLDIFVWYIRYPGSGLALRFQLGHKMKDGRSNQNGHPCFRQIDVIIPSLDTAISAVFINYFRQYIVRLLLDFTYSIHDPSNNFSQILMGWFFFHH
jgi:hypothetical protein